MSQQIKLKECTEDDINGLEDGIQFEIPITYLGLQNKELQHEVKNSILNQIFICLIILTVQCERWRNYYLQTLNPLRYKLKVLKFGIYQ